MVRNRVRRCPTLRRFDFKTVADLLQGLQLPGPDLAPMRSQVRHSPTIVIDRVDVDDLDVGGKVYAGLRVDTGVPLEVVILIADQFEAIVLPAKGQGCTASVPSTMLTK